MEKIAIYIETSVISYLVARPSSDIVVAAHQHITNLWWDSKRDQYDLFISKIVMDEAMAGDKFEAEKRFHALQNIPMLEINTDAISLADDLVRSNAVPKKAAQDALHIAISCVSGIDYLLTWNCKHIANAQMREKIEGVCRTAGYKPPIICTPEELELED